MTQLDLTHSMTVGTEVECSICDWTGVESELDMITDIEQRISPGEVVPAGQCPKCQALAHIVEKEAAPDQTGAALAVAMGGINVLKNLAEKASQAGATSTGCDSIAREATALLNRLGKMVAPVDVDTRTDEQRERDADLSYHAKIMS